jgi:hypothetical protein
MPEDVKSMAGTLSAGKKVFSREGLYRYSMAFFLGALTLMIIVSPFIERFEDGLIEAVLLTLVLSSAVLAVGGRRIAFIWGSMLSVPALAGKWVNYFRPDLVPAEAVLLSGLMFVGFVVLNILGHILRASRVDSEILCAAIANYLMMGLLWSFAYLLVARIVPDAFAFTAGAPSGRAMIGFNSLYFSFTTLSTIGFGDIVPVSGAPRMLAILEAIVGMFYMTMLVARLVSIYSARTYPVNKG